MNVEDLYDLLWDFARHRVVTVAARTGLIERLAEGEGTASGLAAELQLDPLASGKILNALCALGLADVHGDRFRLASELQKYFLPGDGNLRPFLEHSHGLYERWGASLEEWVRTGRHERHERGRRSSEQLEFFGRAMRASASLIAPQVVEALDGLAGMSRALDIGGGMGGYATVFCRAQPSLQVKVIDIPEVAELGREWVAATDFAGRIDFVGGDYHDVDFGEGHDLVLLANVLHIEQPAGAAGLIRRAARALAPGGRLAVVDFAVDDEKNKSVLGTLFAINMRSFGDTHAESAIRGWMQEAGLGGVRTIDLPPAHWLLEGTLI